nr:reverse transcriptase domain-containing protein [Tanacetum cinerariifolium]
MKSLVSLKDSRRYLERHGNDLRKCLAPGVNLLSKTTREALQIIENKSKVRYSRNKPNVSRMNTTSRENVSKTDDKTDKHADQISTLVDIFANKVVTPAPVKAVEESCVTCGRAYAYYNCPNTDSNQPSVCVATGTYNQVAPQSHASNFMAPPGFAPVQNGQNRFNQNQGQGNNFNRENNFQPFQVPNQGFQNQHFQVPNNPVQQGFLNEFLNDKKVNDQMMRNMQNQINSLKGEFKNEIQNKMKTPQTVLMEQQNAFQNNLQNMLSGFFQNQSSTSGTLSSNTIPKPKGEMKAITTRSDIAYERPSIPTPRKKFFQIFQDLHFDISFTAALLLMPKFASTIKSLLKNKDKLFEIAKIPLNENFLAMLLKKLPKKLRDPEKFLIPCDFPGMDVCHALADLELDDRSITRPKGVAEDVFVKVGKFYFLTNFVVVDFEADPRTMRYSSIYDDLSVNRIDIIDVAREEYAQEILEEIDAYLKDESISPKIDHADYDPKGDICLIEKLLNNDPFQLPPMDLNQGEVVKAKPSFEEPPKLELKELPSRLKYTYLEGANKSTVIISKDLKVDEKEALLKVLKSHKRAIAWKIIDINGIDPWFCTHKILMEEDYKPAVQSQRRVNPKIHEIIKKEVIKLLDADSLNAAAGGNLLSKTTREALQIIENKSKVRYTRNKPNVSQMNTTSRENVGKTDDKTDKHADQISTLVDIFANKVVTPAPVKAVEESCVTCGRAHAYYNCPNTDSNQPSVCVTTGTYNQVAPQNHASNFMAPPGFAPVQNGQNRFNQNQRQGNNFNRENNFQPFQVPNQGFQNQHFQVPNQGFQNQHFQVLNNPVQQGFLNEFLNDKKVNDQMMRNMQNQINSLKGEFKNEIQNKMKTPQIVLIEQQNAFQNNLQNMLSGFFQNQSSTSGTLSSNTIPNPKGEMKAITTRSDIAYEGPSIPTPRKSLLTNKDKLFELAKIPLNENCLGMLLKKLPEKLRDPEKFLIPCDFPGMDVCHALADLVKAKPSFEEPPKLELKELPSRLKYAYLEGANKSTVIISKDLKVDEKEALLKVLKSHKKAIAWKITNIKGIVPRFCTHKILMEEDYKPTVQSQRWVNLKIHEVIKKEVIKLLDADFANFHAGNFIVKGMSSQHKKKFFKDVKHYFWDDPYHFWICADQIIRRCMHVKKLMISSKLFIKDPPGAIMVPISPPRNCQGQNVIQVCEIFDVWGIDFIGPFSSSRGNRAFGMLALKHVNFNLKTVGDHQKLQLNELRDQAYENSLIYKEKTKKIHDSKIKNRVFNVGDRVLFFNSHLKILSGKLKTRWSGPFTITKVFQYGTVELSQSDGPNFKVNGHHVKHYFGGDVPQLVIPDLQTFLMDK